MRPWTWLLCLPLVFLTVCAGESSLTRGEDQDPVPGKKPAEGALDLPWKPKEVADTIAALSDPDWNSRGPAIRKVVGAGRWIVPFLLVALKNPERLNRQEVAYCLGRIGDGVAVPSLLEVLGEDPPYDVVVFTVEALGRIGDPAAAGAVRACLDITYEREVYDREVGVTERKAIESREGTVHHAAAEALALLGDTSAVPVLIAGLTDNGWLRRDAAVRLRRLTACAVDFGFHLDMPDTEMKGVQEKWTAWWKENEKTFVPSREPSREAFDVYMPRDGAGKDEGTPGGGTPPGAGGEKAPGDGENEADKD